jgi:hypothetical protein
MTETKDNSDTNNFPGNLMNRNSVLNVEAQKELVDHTIRASTRNALKIFFIIFPTMIVFILIILFGVFYLSGVIR